jgi:hypothetical protein
MPLHRFCCLPRADHTATVLCKHHAKPPCSKRASHCTAPSADAPAADCSHAARHLGTCALQQHRCLGTGNQRDIRPSYNASAVRALQVGVGAHSTAAAAWHRAAGASTDAARHLRTATPPLLGLGNQRDIPPSYNASAVRALQVGGCSQRQQQHGTGPLVLLLTLHGTCALQQHRCCCACLPPTYAAWRLAMPALTLQSPCALTALQRHLTAPPLLLHSAPLRCCTAPLHAAVACRPHTHHHHTAARSHADWSAVRAALMSSSARSTTVLTAGKPRVCLLAWVFADPC